MHISRGISVILGQQTIRIYSAASLNTFIFFINIIKAIYKGIKW